VHRAPRGWLLAVCLPLALGACTQGLPTTSEAALGLADFADVDRLPAPAQALPDTAATAPAAPAETGPDEPARGPSPQDEPLAPFDD
jgi:hypothetical protein